MRKLAIFDLDGVLVKTDHIHTHALQTAILAHTRNSDIIAAPYLNSRDGVRTIDKLERLRVDFNLSESSIRAINTYKKALTLRMFNNVQVNVIAVTGMAELKKQNFQIAVASNSRREFVDALLAAIGVSSFVDMSIAGDEVDQAKPHPEIFLKIMQMMNYTKQETVIFEDSVSGLQAARLAGATVIHVNPDVLVTSNQILAGSQVFNRTLL